MKRTILLVFPFAFLCLSLPAIPQTKEEHHEIVVTATRFETPAREIASSVSVITSEDLERLERSSALEVLRDILGVSITQNGGPGEAASVFLRGANSEHTLVLLDGVELNDPINPSRSADLAHLYLENIERIEVIRGPQSPLYGSDALGGVINIITKKGAGKASVDLAASGGSYGTFVGQGGVSGSVKKANYSFGISQFGTHGVSASDSALPGNSENDGYRNLTLSGRVGLTLRENLEVYVIARSVQAKTDIDNYGGPYGDDPNNVQDYNSYLFNGGFHGLFFNNRWEQSLTVGIVGSRRSNANPTDPAHPAESDSALFKSRLLKIDWQNNFFLHASNTLTVGLEYESEVGESEYLAQGPWGSSASFFPTKNASMAGLYVQDYVRLADQLFFSAGLRFDRHSQAGNSLTYRLAPAYIFKATSTKIRASLGSGFKAPSLYQLYAPGTFFGPIGNMNLEPEKSLGWDVGVEQPFLGEKIEVRATYFQNNFKNLINFDYAQGYTNIGKARSKGLEIEFEGKPSQALFSRASYTHLEAEDAITGAPLLRRPRDLFSASLSYSFSAKTTISVSFDFVGKREDVDYFSWPARTVTLPSYSLLNVIISYDLSPKVQVFGRLDNLLNEKYETVYGYGTAGFSVLVGVRISL